MIYYIIGILIVLIPAMIGLIYIIKYDMLEDLASSRLPAIMLLIISYIVAYQYIMRKTDELPERIYNLLNNIKVD